MKKEYDHKRRIGFDKKLNVIILERLRSKREELGISQREMAKRLNVTQPMISRMEKAEDNLTLTKIDRYVEALGIDLTVQFPINKLSNRYIMSTLTKKVLMSNPIPYEFGIHLADSIRPDGDSLRQGINKFGSTDPPASPWSVINAVIPCNSYALCHKLSLSH